MGRENVGQDAVIYKVPPSLRGMTTMEAYDMLPRVVRDALKYAAADFSAHQAVEFLAARPDDKQYAYALSLIPKGTSRAKWLAAFIEASKPEDKNK